MTAIFVRNRIRRQSMNGKNRTYEQTTENSIFWSYPHFRNRFRLVFSNRGNRRTFRDFIKNDSTAATGPAGTVTAKRRRL
jgi:hypothetical protein